MHASVQNICTHSGHPRRACPPPLCGGGDAPKILLFFHVFCLTLVFFRAADIPAAVDFLGGLFVPGEGAGWPRLAAGAVSLSAALHLLERFLRLRHERVQAWFAARPARAYLEATLFGGVAGVAILVAGAGGEFIYFQF